MALSFLVGDGKFSSHNRSNCCYYDEGRFIYQNISKTLFPGTEI